MKFKTCRISAVLLMAAGLAGQQAHAFTDFNRPLLEVTDADGDPDNKQFEANLTIDEQYTILGPGPATVVGTIAFKDAAHIYVVNESTIPIPIITVDVGDTVIVNF